MKHHAAGSTRKLGCVLLILVLAAGTLSPLASAVSGGIAADIIAVTSQTAVDLEAEGIVLLKNEDGLLPLAGKKLNIFGAGSVSPFYGGGGSGAVTSENPVSFYGALDAEGIPYNAELRKLYESNDRSIQFKTDSTQINNLLNLALLQSTVKEMPVSKLTDKVMQNARAYSETALIMISRTSAEGTDHSAETLALSAAEKALVEKVAAAFPQVIVLFNIGNVMEMGWLEDYGSIKAAAVLWIPGEFGMTAVAQMLSGRVNPSGKLADTIAYSINDHPSSACFGDYAYSGGGSYVEYLEGIYVGYRYFETFAKNKVQYPFGYGLSYTSFRQVLKSHSVNNGVVTLQAEVQNTGKRPGKDTVQVYYSAPYTVGGIEKSAIGLGGFAKTKLLRPGEKQTLTVTFDVNDMASYDHANREAWVLEKGTYKIILGRDVRTHIASFTWTNKNDAVTAKDPVTGTKIHNLFADAYHDFPVLSRATPEKKPQARKLKADGAIKNADKWPEPTKTGSPPKLGARYGKTVALQDVYQDDALWDQFLDQLTLQEMAMLVTNGGYETYGVPRLGIPRTMDNDGPAMVKGRNGILHTDTGTAYPCETAIACTWNTALAERMGKSAGIEARDIGTDVWYAPGANIHRNPRGGRNFEYFSEDPLLSGKMASAIVGGAKAEGLVTTIKHFVLNDQETNRNGVFTWADEQAMREIYLKAFEIPIKEMKPAGAMSAYNRLGTVWCGASSALLNDLLRGEWGFEGFVVSDFSSNFTGAGYMSPVLAVYNGNDTILMGFDFLSMPSHIPAIHAAYWRDPIGFGAALRAACKNICVMKMRSRAFLQPELAYDDSLPAALTPPGEWDFAFPYSISALRFVLANAADAFMWCLRAVF